MSENTNETVALENMTPTERDSWRMTGVEPTREEEVVKDANQELVKEIKSKPAPEEDEVIASEGEEDAASGTATKTEETGKAKKPTQMSYKDLRTRIAELEAKIASGTTKPVAADNEAKAKDEKKDANPRPKSSDKKADGSPKYQTWEEYEDDLLEWRAEKDRAAFKEHSAKEQLTTEKQKLEQESQQALRSRADEARKKYSDFDAKALDPTLKIPQGSVLATWIMDPSNEHGMDIAYHFGTHREELDKFNAMSPFQQARELTRLEDKLSQATATHEKSDVKVITPQPTKVTKAPPPAKEVGGRGASSGDEETSVVNSGDFRAYKRVVDKKEINARK
jgi:hypothetical protein